MRASAPLALELGFPEVSPRALGAVGKRGRGWEVLGQSGHQELGWPHAQSGENVA